MCDFTVTATLRGFVQYRAVHRARTAHGACEQAKSFYILSGTKYDRLTAVERKHA